MSCAAGSAQEQWLRADLAGRRTPCTLAYFHHPRFSSAGSGDNTAVEPLWRALYDADADVVLSAHHHVYERFAPQNAEGGLDPARGLRQFTVGTGGRSLHAFSSPRPNSEVRDNTTFGVLRMRLRGAGYDWQYVPRGGPHVQRRRQPGLPLTRGLEPRAQAHSGRCARRRPPDRCRESARVDE